MFAGPNGSGKSTLKDVVRPEWLGFYVNADEIEVALASSRGFDFASFGIDVSEPELRDFLRNHPLLVRAGLAASSEYLVLERMRLWFGTVAGNSYFAAAIADLVRRRLLARRVAFSFETVMSSQDKVRFLYEARNAGYRTYLYYIATEDPEINVSRVENRVRLGGHGVPRDKIVQRYHRSLSLLTEAIYYSNRAYIFDNSGRAWIGLGSRSSRTTWMGSRFMLKERPSRHGSSKRFYSPSSGSGHRELRSFQAQIGREHGNP